MFWATMCPSSGENTVPMRHLVFVTLYRWLSSMQGGMKCFIPPCIPDSHLYRVTNTTCRIGTVFSPDDGHIVTRKTYRKAMNILRKFVHQVGSIYRRLYKDVQSTEHKIVLLSLIERLHSTIPSLYNILQLTIQLHVLNSVTVEFLFFTKSQFTKTAQNVHLNQRTYAHGLSQTLRSPRVVANGLTGVKNTLKCVFIFNGCWIQNGC